MNTIWKNWENLAFKYFYVRNCVLKSKYHVFYLFILLLSFRYIQAANVLDSEAMFNVKEYAVCDNIHLDSILQDYESYYFLKYQKLPQIMKKVPEGITFFFN